MSMFPAVESGSMDLVSMLEHDQVEDSAEASGGKAFMKFDFMSGRYTFGREAEDITGSELVVNFTTMTHGWTVWANNKPTKESAHFTKPLPPRIPAVGGNEPTESRSFTGRFLDDDDTEIEFSTNSHGGRQGADKLRAEIKLRASMGETTYLFPIVELTSTSYANQKQGGKLTYNPVFKIVGWVNANGEECEEKKAIAPPVRKAKAKTEDVVEDVTEVVEEAPVRKRRRRA